MNATQTFARRLLTDERGATAIEYGLLVALIAVVLIGTVAALGNGVMTRLFQHTSSQLSSAIETAS
jgi:pilus assembly protein Flp/PilA